jgi:RND family efflux transporter MFP subunit
MLPAPKPRYFLAAFLALALVACHSPQQEDPRTQITLVRAATVQDGGPALRSFTGIVVARVQSDLGFRVGGKIVERLVDAGQAVKVGQPLLRIDPTDLALASIAQAGAVEAARARALQTAADEKRYGDLVSAGAVSASAYDQVKAAADAAKAQLSAAEAQANVVRNEATYAVLLADADGVVMETLAEPGQVVAAAQTVVRLAHSGPREAVIDLPETIRPAIGSVATTTVFSDANKSGVATLRQLSAVANAQTRTFEARYVLQGAAAAAPLGSTVTIQLADNRAGSIVQIPLSAIYDEGKGPGVWVIEGAESHVTWRRVELAGIGEEMATVADGLKTGEQFVALGAHLLHQGMRIRVASQLEVTQQ